MATVPRFGNIRFKAIYLKTALAECIMTAFPSA